jgi:RNA polymerase sigma factor (sigma-70 family)
MANVHDGPLQAALPAAQTAGHMDGHHGFDTFYRDEYSPLVHFVRRRGSTTDDDPEELAQESLTRLLPYVSRHPTDVWRPLLYRIATNLVKERWRRTQGKSLPALCVPLDELVRSGQEPVCESPEPDEAAAEAQRQARLAEVVQALPAQCRRVYIMRFVRGLTNAEIAERCGISMRMVEKHLARSVQRIRQVLTHDAAGV